MRAQQPAPSAAPGASPVPVLPLRIIVPGTIVPWQRPQRKRLASGATVTFTNPTVEAYHAVVRMAAERVMAGHPPLEGPLEVTIRGVFAVPVSWSRKRQTAALAGTIAKVTKPDIENMLKGAMDALQSVAYADDRQIVRLVAEKVYGVPCLDITLQELHQS